MQEIISCPVSQQCLKVLFTEQDNEIIDKDDECCYAECNRGIVENLSVYS